MNLVRETTKSAASLVAAALLCCMLALIACAIVPEKAYASGSSYGFSDVRGDEWFAIDEVLGYAIDKGILKGYSNGRFGPYDSVTRGQVAVVLHRMAGELEVQSAEPFYDVDYGRYYGASINWARSAGVISGYDDGSFGPDDPVTREQLVTMLERYAREIGGLDTSVRGDELAGMLDGPSVSVWAKGSVCWAVGSKIITGFEGRVLPQGRASRCEAAKMFSVLHRDLLEGLGEIEIDQGVKVVEGAESVSTDGLRAVLAPKDASGVKTGDIVVVMPTQNDPEGSAIRVSAVDGNEIRGTRPTVGEVASTASINQRLMAVGFTPNDDVSLMGVDGSPVAMSASTKSGDIVIDLWRGEYAELGDLYGKITIRPEVMMKFDLATGTAAMTAEGTMDLDIDIEDSLSLDSSNNLLGYVTFVGPYGFSAVVEAYLVAGVDGRVSIDSTVEFKVWFDNRKPNPSLAGAEFYNQETSMEAKVSATVGAGVTATGKFLGIELADLGAEGGCKANAKLMPRTVMTCLDVKGYLYAQCSYHVLDAAFGSAVSNDCIPVLTESNSPFAFSAHYEDGSKVEKCTWDGGADINVEENGYGDIPLFEEGGGYVDRLKEPFNINAGTRFQVGKVGASMALGSSWWYLRYDCAPGTLAIMTFIDSDGSVSKVSSLNTTTFGSTNLRCEGQPVVIEVFRGRVTVTSIYGWYAPAWEKGTCQIPEA